MKHFSLFQIAVAQTGSKQFLPAIVTTDTVIVTTIAAATVSNRDFKLTGIK